MSVSALHLSVRGTFFVKKYKVMSCNRNANFRVDSLSVNVLEVLPLEGHVVCYLGSLGPTR